MVTNFIKGASYKEIYDLHTDSESTSILTIHSPVSNFPRKVLSGFFNQYRKFRYLGCRVSIRPAARLPADPAQLSYAAGEPEIDARDMLNPVLYRGYSGESLGYFLNIWNSPGRQSSNFKETPTSNPVQVKSSGFFGDSIDKTSFPENAVEGFTVNDWRSAYLEKLYYQSLSDPKFKKMAPQKGMSKFFYPLVYELATTTQRLSNTAYGGQTTSPNIYNLVAYEPQTHTQQVNAGNIRETGGDIDPLDDTARTGVTADDSSAEAAIGNTPEISLYSSQVSLDGNNVVRYMRRTVPILTSHKRRLGWLDTDTRVVRPYAYSNEVRSNYPDNGSAVFSSPGTSINLFPDSSRTRQVFPDSIVANTTLPLINMGIIALPKSYKTEMYFRVTCQHFFDFKGYRPTYGLVSPFDTTTLDGPTLEWNDWDDDQIVFPSASLTSTSKNVDLVDVSQ